MQPFSKLPNRRWLIWGMSGIAVFIWSLEVFSLFHLLPQANSKEMFTGLLGLAIALALVVGLLIWVLSRQFLGHYEERIAGLNRDLQEANEKLKELSLTDPLTSLYNRRFFDDRLGVEFRRSRRTGKPLSLLLVDLDNFKSINDRFGHLMGDEVLTACGEILRTQIRRGGDLVARYGGEEFVAVLPETDVEAAKEKAEKILEQLRHRAFVHDGSILHISASIGVADSEMQSSEISLLRAADGALYAAKRAGKNQVMLASPEQIELLAVAQKD